MSASDGNGGGHKGHYRTAPRWKEEGTPGMVRMDGGEKEKARERGRGWAREGNFELLEFP